MKCKVFAYTAADDSVQTSIVNEWLQEVGDITIIHALQSSSTTQTSDGYQHSQVTLTLLYTEN